ncbi:MULTISPECIES: NAD(P)H-quinone oxidoreductase subunit F [unclassified Okeania]|uniref:NAD(P)H-quinone oxidoreductase subunit F n=1 Tax=unclassified Okeania TaxID=2634635 RepID=UPI0013B7A025|nr:MULTISPECIES: NAD(P)H-quinone oxidoreductase subunit F [unclassified Okeania]NET12235.1 NAD(P)H-quinone oxidoreductase subunit F [Okeania sp. SIO1H6]NES79756.1 NAD(P)H-quinone oxidoreductase subunit F [Okeania sp. SIO1H4]NET22602.1 NAD(P)H-quinone oxidoreductase subunit F [Okeania sp. SIO1H5]NET79248.1 NAD(P)H-quinone oxidoreductase subunit F [Okeania sp. SIO1F9]NET95752.1 NAD(P)H-quinone oxidoreductase subunit F [Okeania sp. SIO1H2]
MLSNDFLETVWLIPCYAIVGAALAIPWSPGIIKRTGPRPAGYINLIMTFIAFLHGLIALSVAWNQPTQELSIPWLDVAGLNITISLEISTLTIGATILITGLNLLSQIYAIAYMEMDWGWARFYSLLALFEAGMCALVLCNSLFWSYIILEILTLGTYLLVGLWFSQPLVVTGARDAFLTKRVGDLFLLMGVVALLPLAGTWNYTELAEWAKTANIAPTTATLLSLTLIAGPLGKCAQFPLHLWLDEAMEGPVPSTILRNSVVVAVGAWVLIKLQPVLALSPVASTVMIGVGVFTAVCASLIAIAQIDIKRSLSYSVSTYMGLVFIAVGTGQDETALMLLFTYACAMALLVMSTGGVILNCVSQDLTQYGGLWSRRPITGISYLVGAAGLVGLPPLGSFWALLQMTDYLWSSQPWLVGVLLLVNGFTAFSIIREFGLIFCGQPKQMTERSPEGLWALVLPMTILAGFTLHIPLLFAQWQLLPDIATINKTVAGLLLLSSVLGFGIGGLIYLNDGWEKPIKFPLPAIQDFFAYDFYTAKLYRITIVFVVGLVSRIISWVDRYLVDGVVNFVGLATVFGGQGLKYNVSGQSQFYVLTILIGMTLLLSWLVVGLF